MSTQRIEPAPESLYNLARFPLCLNLNQLYSALVQWLGSHALTVMAGVRFPDAEALLLINLGIFIDRSCLLHCNLHFSIYIHCYDMQFTIDQL